MKIHEVEQGSLEWMILRAGIPTASEFDNLVTPEWKIRTGEMPYTYLCKKLAEWWQGGPLPSFSGGAAEQGQLLESEAIPYYELKTGKEVKRVGFITTDDGSSGCSPDGMIVRGGELVHGIEIKCPEAHTQTKYVLGAAVPKEYQAQVQGSMYVTKRDVWEFLSYRRGFPPLLLIVGADPRAQEALEIALAEFNDRLRLAKEKMIAINGEPPKRDLTPAPTPMKQAREPQKPFVSEIPS